MKKLLTEKNQYINKKNIHMILENLEQQEHLVKIFIMVKLVQKKPMNINQIQRMKLKNLKTKQDQKVQKKNKKKKLLLIICINFLRLEKKFLIVLKAKYF